MLKTLFISLCLASLAYFAVAQPALGSLLFRGTGGLSLQNITGAHTEELVFQALLDTTGASLTPEYFATSELDGRLAGLWCTGKYEGDVRVTLSMLVELEPGDTPDLFHVGIFYANLRKFHPEDDTDYGPLAPADEDDFNDYGSPLEDGILLEEFSLANARRLSASSYAMTMALELQLYKRGGLRVLAAYSGNATLTLPTPVDVTVVAS